MEAKPWIWNLGRFISLPFILVAAVGMIVWHILLTFWFSVWAAYITIRGLYDNAPAKEETLHGQP